MITILSSVQALRRLGDHRQQIDQMFHVHLAAVVGKGIEAALHAERKQDAPVGVRCKGGVFGSQTVAQTLFNAVGKDPLPCPGERCSPPPGSEQKHETVHGSAALCVQR